MISRTTKAGFILFVLYLLSACADLSQAQRAFDQAHYSKAFRAWNSLSRKGFPEAHYGLGKLYARGLGVSPDYQRARAELLTAAEGGVTSAAYELGRLYENPLFEEFDQARAIRYYRAAAGTGNLAAELALAEHSLTGNGVPLEIESGLATIRQLSQSGYAPASYRLARLYETGVSVPQNDEMAARWYLTAMQQKHPNAEFRLARFYLQGRGVTQDVERGLAIYRRYAARGNADASYALGRYYEAMEQSDSLQQALSWYRQASQQGHVDADTRIAFFALKSADTTDGLDQAAALALLTTRAKAGNAQAAYALGDYYAGSGKPRAAKSGRYWYGKAATSGHVAATYKLGRMWEEGRGGAKGLIKAVRYYKQVAAAHPASAYRIAVIYDTRFRRTNRNKKQALKWYRSAADQGLVKAEPRIAELLLSGIEGSAGKAKALARLQRAVEQGNASAMYSLGRAYARGVGHGREMTKGLGYVLAAARARVDGAVGTAVELMNRMRARQIRQANSASKQLFRAFSNSPAKKQVSTDSQKFAPDQ